MHELAIVKEIVRTAIQSAEEQGAGRITAVRVRVGEFTAVEPESLTFCFRVVAEGTIAEGAALEIAMVPLAACCSACDRPFHPLGLSLRCPGCGSARVEITSGRELQIESIEVR